MESFCYKSFVLLGVNPHSTIKKLRVTVNIILVTCFIVLAGFKCYFDGDLDIIEPINALILINVKYLTLALGKKTIKKLLKAMDNFWKIDVIDDQVIFLLQYFNGVANMYKNILIFAILIYAVGPFVSKASSIFSCYVPPCIPFPIFYTVEFYIIINAAFVYISFNIFICSLIIFVKVQFRLVNLRIKDLNVKDIENNHDVKLYVLELKTIIRYQQFLMRCVDDLNKLLSVPIALLMITSVSLICITMYNITVHQGPISDKGRMLVIVFSLVTEFFLVYGLPAQLLMDESTATADAIYWECKWYLPILRPLRTSFLIMMIRSQKDVCIVAGNYHVINNGTVLLLLKTAYSFYTFLQKVV